MSPSGDTPAPLVRLGNRVLPVTVVREHPERFVDLFIRARTERGHAECLCRSDAPQRLVIRRRAQRFHLAGWPDQGHHHAPQCDWYRADPTYSGRGAYRADAILSTEVGTSIRLAASFVTPISPSRTTTPAAPASGTGRSRHSLTLLALLHWLWEQAGLSLWIPGPRPRTWRTCHGRLVHVISDTVVKRRPLADTLFVVPPYRADLTPQRTDAFEQFTAALTTTARERRSVLVLGELRTIDPTPHGVRVRLAHLRTGLFATTGLHAKIRRAARSAFAAGDRARRVVLCLITRTRHDNVVIDDMAVMLTTPAYLPADSGYEVMMGNALVAAGRRFCKPLRYDRGSAVFPDVVLLDSHPPTYVEVWGIHDRADYEARKRAKQHHYRATGTPIIEWDVRDPLPARDITAASAPRPTHSRHPSNNPGRP